MYFLFYSLHESEPRTMRILGMQAEREPVINNKQTEKAMRENTEEKESGDQSPCLVPRYDATSCPRPTDQLVIAFLCRHSVDHSCGIRSRTLPRC
jgi:hypothetical protein